MKPPKYSVLLPTHNRPETLVLALRSVFQQTEQDFEVLVVGDGCTDNTAEEVRGFDDLRIVWFDLPKAPHYGYANRNAALRQARGELIAFMAHDDLWFPDHLQQLGALFKDPAIELAYSMPLWIAPDGFMTPTPFNLHDPELADAFLRRRRNVMPAACVVHRRNCFEKYGYWNADLPGCGDWDMWIRILEGGGLRNFVYLPVPTCVHFRAIWRRKPLLEPREIIASYRTRSLFPRWDDVLRVDATGFALEQQAVWHAVETGGPAWVDELRRNIAGYLDRRNLEMDVHPAFQSQEAEIWGLHAALHEAGFVIHPPGHSFEFEGFEEFDRHRRWLKRSGKILIKLDEEEADLVMDFSCMPAEQYDSFPFEFRIGIGQEVVRRLAFNRSYQRRNVRLRIRGQTTIELCSDAVLRDTGQERSVMLTRLRVGRRTTWGLGQWCRRMAAAWLKDE